MMTIIIIHMSSLLLSIVIIIVIIIINYYYYYYYYYYLIIIIMMMMINIIGININIIVTCVKDDVAGKIKTSETGLYSYDASIVERLNISTALIAFIDPV